MTMDTRNIQYTISNGGGTSQQVSVTTTSAQSTVIDANLVHMTVQTAAVFVRSGDDPVALSNGTDQLFSPGTYLVAIPRGKKLAFIVATGSATVSLTPVRQ